MINIHSADVVYVRKQLHAWTLLVSKWWAGVVHGHFPPFYKLEIVSFPGRILHLEILVHFPAVSNVNMNGVQLWELLVHASVQGSFHGGNCGIWSCVLCFLQLCLRLQHHK